MEIGYNIYFSVENIHLLIRHFYNIPLNAFSCQNLQRCE